MSLSIASVMRDNRETYREKYFYNLPYIMYKMVAMTDWRIRGEDDIKFDYKKGATITLKRLESREFFRQNGWKSVEDKDMKNQDSAMETRKADIAKARKAK